ncbi:MAG: DNA-binding protein [Candidatus Omnitrophica bacterium]|nr:DNA-binding protein [Candidatus Omnitrophota bacterium]
MTIKPIKTEKDYHAALNAIESIWDAKPNTKNGDLLDILTTLVEAYERKNYPICPPSPVEAIKFRMEQMGLKNSDIAPYLGGQNRVSEVFRNKRTLTVGMIKKLHDALRIPYESLIPAQF